MKRLFVELMCALVLVSLCAFAVSAEVYTGQCGENVTYTHDEEAGILTISGEGEMWDYFCPETLAEPECFYENFPDWIFGMPVPGGGYDPENPSGSDYIYEYEIPDFKKVIIGEGVTYIGQHAFYGCGVAELVLPDSLTGIACCAFGYNPFDAHSGLYELRCDEFCDSFYGFAWDKEPPIIVCNNDTYAAEFAVENGASVHYYQHSVVETETTAAACLTAGTKRIVCNECSYSSSIEIPATGHVNTTETVTAPTKVADAVKTVTCACGEVVSTETVIPTDITITFQHNVRFQVDEYLLLFAAMHTDLANTTDRWAEFKTYNYDDNGNPVTNVTLVNPDTATATHKVFISPDISAKQMNDKIEVTYYCIADGVKYKSQVDTYNLVDYYFAQQGNGTDLEALLIEMLNYGAAAQKQLGNYNVTAVEGDRYTGLVNLHLPEELRKNDLDAYGDITTSVARNPHGDTTGMTYKFQANNGRFKQRISVLYAFKLLDGKTDIDMNNLVFKGTYTGLNDETNKDYVTKTVEIKGSEGGFEKSGTMLVVAVDALSVKDLRATILNGALYDLEGNRVSETVDSGFESYVHGYTGTNANMKLLMKATLSYSDAAKTYFMNK